MNAYFLTVSRKTPTLRMIISSILLALYLLSPMTTSHYAEFEEKRHSQECNGCNG